MRRCALTLLCSLTFFFAQAQLLQPHEVIAQFFSALNSHDFAKAFTLCGGKRWGTYAYFSSPASYGGVTAVEVHSIEEQKDYGSEATLICSTTVMDKVNGTGTFKQAFTLKKQTDNHWLITNIKLIESNRPTDNWILNMTVQNDFSLADVKRLTKPVYDTVKNEPLTESPDDIMKRNFTNLSFIKTDKGLFAIGICENQGPQYGVYTGWCDVFAFKKEANGWQLASMLLQAGGGGRMGYPGKYERKIRVGDLKAGIVISSYFGQSGIEYTAESIIAFEDGILSSLTSIATDYSRDDSFSSPPSHISNQYSFVRNGKADYDLLIEQYDESGKKPRKINIDRIVYQDGYLIPAKYEFEN